jgi:exodeoxyribonuclease V gamma subunit
MLKIVHGNRLEPLAGELMRSLLDLPASPFERESIVVPSLGVARWLQYRIADVQSVCAHMDFSFAAQFVWQTFANVLEGVPQRSPFDANVMTLRLHGQLGRLPASEVYSPLRSYIERAGERGRIELAQRLAQVFDRYLVYRPEWLQSWAAGSTLGIQPIATERWQLGLWRRLVEDAGLRELQHPAGAVFDKLQSDIVARTRLPRKIRLFALPTLPPQYVQAVTELARYTDVEWYVVNPCRQYWGDLVSERTAAKLAGDDAPSTEVAHPLLASWGLEARDHLAEVLARSDAAGVVEQPMFVDPGNKTLLTKLQRCLLELAPLSESLIDPQQLDAGIRAQPSLQIHACHSLTRQLEVLHDQLLRLFDMLPELKPQEVLVMLPGVDDAAPLIDAVFGAAPLEHRLAYSITGRAAPDATPLLRAFDTLLHLPASRFEAAEVFDHLQIPAVRARYSLESSDLDLIRQWLDEAGIRWGLDAAHRVSLDLPAEARHSWLDGLMRLLLGYAAPSGGEHLIAGIEVYEEIEGSQAVVAGKLLRALGDLVGLRRDFATPRSVALWCDRLARMLEEQLSPLDEDESDAQRLRSLLSDLRDDAALAEQREAVSLEVMQGLLKTRLAGSSPGGVPGGGVTFTGIGPLRGLPYRVVCVIGLDGGVFPRNPSTSEFDLIARHPRRGDRSRGQDDRGAFLDALLAAREVFYLSYTGRSIRDNAELPPSVLISELLDYVGRYTQGGLDAATAALLVEHPLQPFAPRHFLPGASQSYAREYREAALQIARGSRRDDARGDLLAGTTLAAPGDEARVLRLDQLIGCLRNPYRFFLRDRLGIRIDEGEEELSSEEPLTLPEPRWDFERRLLDLALAGHESEAIVAKMRAGTDVPHGRWGEHLLNQAVEPALGFAKVVLAERGPSIAPLPFECRIGPYTLSGVLDGLSADGLYRPRYGKQISAHDWIEAWPRHLLLCLLKPDGVAPITRLRTGDDGKKSVAALGTVADASARLLDLLDLYWQGLQAPLEFMPKTALAAVVESQKPEKAAKVWLGDSFGGTGEAENEYCRMFYRGLRETMPDALPALAARVFAPMLAAVISA